MKRPSNTRLVNADRAVCAAQRIEANSLRYASNIAPPRTYSTQLTRRRPAHDAEQRPNIAERSANGDGDCTSDRGRS